MVAVEDAAGVVFPSNLRCALRVNVPVEEAVADPGDGEDRSLSAYMRLPVDQYVGIELPMGATMRRVPGDPDLFQLEIPGLKFLSLEVRPVVRVRVRLVPDGDAVSTWTGQSGHPGGKTPEWRAEEKRRIEEAEEALARAHLRRDTDAARHVERRERLSRGCVPRERGERAAVDAREPVQREQAGAPPVAREQCSTGRVNADAPREVELGERAAAPARDRAEARRAELARAGQVERDEPAQRLAELAVRTVAELGRGVQIEPRETSARGRCTESAQPRVADRGASREVERLELRNARRRGERVRARVSHAAAA